MSFSLRRLSVAHLLVTGVIVAAPLFAGCGNIPEEEGAQYPQGAAPEAIGVDHATRREEIVAQQDLTGTPYAAPPVQAGQPVGTVTIGGDPGGAPGGDEYADTDPSALSDFHDTLAPYGAWVEDPSYGTLWQPSGDVVGGDFAPYETGGHWSYGDDYVWVSDYSWGWAPFHYGRWVYATNGWGWIPGRQYAGAWTTWRTGYGPAAGYVGWAPLPPTYYWRNGVAVGVGAVPPAPYAFCATNNLFAPSLAGHMMTGPGVGAIGQSTRPFEGAQTARGGGYAGGVASAGGAFGGRSVAHPEIAGPSPASMHIEGHVPRPPANNSGLVRASQFAHPSTATALGGHAPVGWSGNRASAPSSVASSRPFGSSMGTSAYGSGYAGNVHGETRTLGQSPGYVHPYAGGGGGYFGGGGHGAPAYSYGGGHGFGHVGGGVHGGGAAPHYQPPSYGGGYHPPSGGGFSGGGHSGGGRGGGGGHGGGHR